MSDTKLLPCPFCNGESMLSGNPGSSQMYVLCKDCGAKSGYGYRDKAITAWNTRHRPTPEALSLEELEGMDRANGDVPVVVWTNGPHKPFPLLLNEGTVTGASGIRIVLRDFYDQYQFFATKPKED